MRTYPQGNPGNEGSGQVGSRRDEFMTLAEMLEAKFRGDIRFRGAAYLKAERVAVVRVTTDQLYAVVRDGVDFHVQLGRDEGNFASSCSCQAVGKNGTASCKHVWATILAVDEQDLLSGAPKPGFVPPFVTEADPLPFEDSVWDEDDDESGGPIKLQPTLRKVATPPVAPPRQRDWEVKLRELRRNLQGEETQAATSIGREREILYELDIAASEEAGQLIIQTSQRQRRSNGSWGILKPLKLKPGKFDEIDDDEDRRILAHLVGGTPDRSSGASGTEAQAAFRYRVPHDLCELLLPAMCATGRVRLLAGEEAADQSLDWDDGAPWELCLAIEQDTADQSWKANGYLRRETGSIALREPTMMLPGGIICHEQRLSRLNDFDAFAWVPLLRHGPALQVAAGEEHDLVDRLLDMPVLPRLELPESLRLEEVQLEPECILLVHAPAKNRWQTDRLKCEVLFDYGGTPIRGSSVQWAIVQREQGRCLVRSRKVEEQSWTLLQENGFRRLLDHRRSAHDVEIPARELGASVRRLIAAGWSVRADGKQVRQPSELKFQVKSGVDWFELHANLDFAGRRLGLPELLAALARGESTVYLDDGSLGILPEEWMQKYGLLGGLGVVDGDHLRFEKSQVGLLDALLLAQGEVDYDSRFIQLREQLASFSGVRVAEEPKEFHGELRTYQREGVGWLQFLEEFAFGGCLADDMGLGKTIQLLAFLEDRRSRKLSKHPTLVVVPKSLLFNWRQEAERFTPNLKVLEYAGLDRAPLRDTFSKFSLILTTYGTLRRDIVSLKDYDFDYILLDEAQTIKNAGSQVAKAVRLLKSERRVALTGTPIENHLGDLCSIFDFLNPGMLGRSSLFKLHAANPEDVETRKVLAAGLRPFILRRTKQSVANELPEKLEQTIHCPMGAEQQRLYDELRDHYRESLLGMIDEQGLARSRMHVLEALLRLRQAACHPALLQKGVDTDSSAKLDVLIPRLQELVDEGHKTLVFSQFTSMLSIVRKHLDQMGLVYEYLDGQTRDRQERVERFQNDPNCGVFLISLKAGGLGLNLTAADYVYILDPWWNPAVETQAIDRAHRVGQTRQVFAYRLICQNTVEEKIAELQKQKRELAEAILEENQSVFQKLTTEDLKILLS